MLLTLLMLAPLCSMVPMTPLTEMRAYLQEQLSRMRDEDARKDMEFFDGVYETNIRQKLHEIEHLIGRSKRNSTRANYSARARSARSFSNRSRAFAR